MDAVKQIVKSLPPSRARKALLKATEGEDLSHVDMLALFQAEAETVEALYSTAHALRLAQASPFATYVVNRNINFTNICYNRCTFCAYSRPSGSKDAFLWGPEEIVRRARQAAELGATEVCIQAGLAPQLDARFYLDVCRSIRRALPGLHIHGFSPQEILYAARKSYLSISEYVGRLKDAGLGSIPGTSAEILDNRMRMRLSPGRLTVQQWIEVIESAHRQGLRTTATMMYGHIEDYSHRADHLLLLRDLQRSTGGFTEFVPLRFVSRPDSPLASNGGQEETLKTHAIARLALGKDIPNIQVSWVKEGLAVAARCLRAGANDLGGTLIDEAISASAGASNGQLRTPRELRACIRKAGFTPAQRSTLYETLRIFEDPVADPIDPIDRLSPGAVVD